MKAMHRMPFGAEHRDGATRFRLWAPACESVSLMLGRDGARSVPMASGDEGWHEVTLDALAPGEAYAFRVDGGSPVPDPASRSNPWDVHAPSVIVDPHAYQWRDETWRGRPWREAVLYELHVGAFTPAGTFSGAIERLNYLADLGITAIELMPLADFAGQRNWGYDGVLPFAPDSAYGTPEELKQFIDEAHRRGLMVILDVVYNHFGPDGNYLSRYAPQFFNAAHQTPWGAAINFDGPQADAVRDFFVHNALFWIEEYRFDGLRLDAVHAIADDSPKHIVIEIAEALQAGPGRQRHVHLILENDANQAQLLERSRPHATAQWNDDSHHAFHVLVSGETDGYYRDYASAPAQLLARTLTEGFGYQGEPSSLRNGERRGEPSAHLPPIAFIDFLQNHDQVGNRALGERLAALASPEKVRLAIATLCLAPAIPMLFMGEECGAATPFLYFCDFHGELATAVREGRRREFAAFEHFHDPAAREAIPDPNALETFIASRIDWDCLERPAHAQWHEHYRKLLWLRARDIVPRLDDAPARGSYVLSGQSGIGIEWMLADGMRLHLRANFGDNAVPLAAAAGRRLHREGPQREGDRLPAWAGEWTLEEP